MGGQGHGLNVGVRLPCVHVEREGGGAVGLLWTGASHVPFPPCPPVLRANVWCRVMWETVEGGGVPKRRACHRAAAKPHRHRAFHGRPHECGLWLACVVWYGM